MKLLVLTAALGAAPLFFFPPQATQGAGPSSSTSEEEEGTSCHDCDTTKPSLPAGISQAWFKLDISTLSAGTGECRRSVPDAKCNQKYKACRFQGRIVLTETDPGAMLNPTPLSAPGVAGWVLTSGSGQRKWEFNYGTGSTETDVACGDEDTFGLMVAYTPQGGGGQQSVDIKVKCGKCPDTPDGGGGGT